MWKIRKDALAFNFGKLNYSENRICVIICLNIVSWYKCLFLKSMPFKNGKRKFSWNDVIRDNIHESINNAGYRQTNPKNTVTTFPIRATNSGICIITMQSVSIGCTIIITRIIKISLVRVHQPAIPLDSYATL